MVELEEAYQQLESSMGKMMQVQWGSASRQEQGSLGGGHDEEDDG
jgi:hypothetical protein